MLSNKEILETINMVSEQHLDVRTITMGISLLDCISDSKKKTCQKVYDKITNYAENLVSIGNQISKEIGVPIVNKRVSITIRSFIPIISRSIFSLSAICVTGKS